MHSLIRSIYKWTCRIIYLTYLVVTLLCVVCGEFQAVLGGLFIMFCGLIFCKPASVRNLLWFIRDKL